MIPELPDPALLPAPTHPNYNLWRDYLVHAGTRGELVALVLADFMLLSDAHILDIGAGTGGASLALNKRGAHMTAIDSNPDKCAHLQTFCQRQNLKIAINASTFPQEMPENCCYDAAVLQDVIEHVENRVEFVAGLSHYLKPGGLVFISTPNRWSPINFIADPHWQLPVVAALNRPLVRFFIHRIFHRETGLRADLPVLLSLKRLLRLFNQAGFSVQLINRRVCRLAFENPYYLFNDRTHLKLMHYAQKLTLAPLICRLVNDRAGFFNYLLNPTWFLIARKIDSSPIKPAS